MAKTSVYLFVYTSLCVLILLILLISDVYQDNQVLLVSLGLSQICVDRTRYIVDIGIKNCRLRSGSIVSLVVCCVTTLVCIQYFWLEVCYC